MRSRTIVLVLGNQLFPTRALKDHKDALVFMVEDPAACTYVRHHKHKLILILSAMRAYAAGLRASGFEHAEADLGALLSNSLG